MTAVKLSSPYIPRSDTENVLPVSSAGETEPSRTLAASSRLVAAILRQRKSSSASKIVGTSSPSSAADRDPDVHP